MKKINIAVAQLECSVGNKESNLVKMERSIEEAHSLGADILVLPELFLTGFVSKQDMVPLAEPRRGDSFLRIIRKLKEYPVNLVYSFPEYVSEEEIYNTTCLISKEGIALGYYRKVHLFDAERKIVRPGSEFIDVEVEGVKMGLLTCFDIEFPEAARTLALRGIKVLLVNSANMDPYGFMHRTFITARAIENHLFVAYSNIVGKNDFYEYPGEAAIVQPDGQVIVETNDLQEGIVMGTVDLGEIDSSKTIYNYLEERRPELYG